MSICDLSIRDLSICDVCICERSTGICVSYESVLILSFGKFVGGTEGGTDAGTDAGARAGEILPSRRMPDVTTREWGRRES